MPAKVISSARSNASVPALVTLPASEPLVPPLPTCSVPAAMSMPPP